LFLSVVGLVNLVSASPTPNFWHRQLISFVIGFGMMMLVAGIHYRLFEQVAYPFYALIMMFLLLTVLWGTLIGGSRSWLRIGPWSMQPSEFVKIATVLAMAKYFHDQHVGGPYGLRQLLTPALIGLCPVTLIMLQPDLGTATMLGFIVVGMILFVGVRRRLIVVGVVLAMVMAPLSWKVMKAHQKDRIYAFINPGVDPTGTGYNVIQSMVTVGSGRVVGKGYKLGTQTALKYLPEVHTDFVFSVLGEEWGFIGCFILLGCFLFLLLWGIKIAAGAKDRFGALTALGVVLLIFWHTVINIAMTLGVFPVVGIPLPFLSYGGSFLISVFVGMGMLMSIEERRFMF